MAKSNEFLPLNSMTFMLIHPTIYVFRVFRFQRWDNRRCVSLHSERHRFELIKFTWTFGEGKKTLNFS